MPPRAVSRRTSSRLATSEPDENRSSSPAAPQLPALSRPNLPKLTGTPASRRQYTYGSAAEPPPSRPGRGLRMDQPLDLGNAVGNVLNRQHQEDEAYSRRQMPPPPRPNADVEDEDELAGELPPEPQPRRPGRPKKSTTRQESKGPLLDNNGYNTRHFAPISPEKHRRPTRQQSEEMRDDRSFGTESSYYGDASIRSSPAPAPTPAATKSTGKNTQKRASKLRQETPLDVVEEAPPASQQPPSPRPAPSHQEAAEEPEVPAPEPGPEAEPEPAVPLRAATRPEDTLSVRRPRRTPKTSSLQTPQLQSRPTSRTQAITTQAESLHTTIEHDGATSHFRAARRPLARQGESGGFIVLPNKERDDQSYASNHSQADDAMQQDIAAASQGDDNENETPSTLKKAWIRVKNFSSPRAPALPPWLSDEDSADSGPASGHQSLRPRHVQHEVRQRTQTLPDPRPPIDQDEEDNANNTTNTTNWWYLLYYRTYIDALFKLMDAVTDRLELLMLTVFSFSGRKFGQWVLYILGAASVAALLVSNASNLADLFDSMGNSIPSIPRSDLSSGLSDTASKVGDFASSIRIPIPSFNWQHNKPSMWEGLDDTERDDLEAYLRKFDVDFQDLRSASSLHGVSIEKLEQLLPHIIHVQSSNGKLTIGTDFYYAMRDKLRDDETVLTFDEKGGDYVVSSDKQWRSLVHGISNDPSLDKKLNLSMSSIENQLANKMASFWDSWIKDNDDKITAQLGTALESLKAANSKAELDGIVKELVQDQIRESSSDGGILVSRDEFIKQLHREFKVHRHEIRSELDDLQPQLKTLIQDTVRLANTEHTPPAGMTREDVTTLVNTLIRKAIADTDLKAMAQGKIHAHWDADLKNQVNYFAVGGGAITDPKISSATYDPHNQGLASMDAYAKGLRGAKPLPPLAALQRWDDEGDCWCAAREVNHRGNPHGATLSVLMGHQIVPQHIVIEHILPGATSDPGARPREIEVHIRIEDPEVLSRVEDFSATHFSERSDDWNNQPADLGPRFVKVAQFTYEGAELHDGVHVQRLSRELVEMGAETDQVVVRAINNYGAKEHTCFYRVRLYGERIGVDI